MQDYILEGNNHYKVDRSAAKDILHVFPEMKTAENANVMYKKCALQHLSSCGIRQFIDVGMGFSRSPNLHEVVHPDSSVIYIDNDPIVLSYSDDLLVGSSESTHCVLVDVTETDQVIAALDTTGGVDFDQPVALCLHAVLHLVSGERDPYGSVGRLMDRMAPGSYVSLTHYASDIDVESLAAVAGLCEKLDTPFYPRTLDQVLRFFQDWEPVLRGVDVASVAHERSVEDLAWTMGRHIPLYAGMARKVENGGKRS